MMDAKKDKEVSAKEDKEVISKITLPLVPYVKEHITLPLVPITSS